MFSVDSLGRQMIRNFSLMQRLHLLLELLYGECDERMRQEIKCSMLLSLRVQMCLLSSVEFLCLAWRNDAVWFLYLVLKSFSLSPMYVSVVLLSLRVVCLGKLLMVAFGRRAGMRSFVSSCMSCYMYIYT